MPAGGVLTAAMSRSPLNKRPPDGDANLDGDGNGDVGMPDAPCSWGRLWLRLAERVGIGRGLVEITLINVP